MVLSKAQILNGWWFLTFRNTQEIISLYRNKNVVAITLKLQLKPEICIPLKKQKVFLVFSKLNSNSINANIVTMIYSDINEFSALTINQNQHRKTHLFRDKLCNGILFFKSHQDISSKIYL